MRRTLLATAAVAVAIVGGGCGAAHAPKAIVHHPRHKVATVAVVAQPAGATVTATLHGDTPGSPAAGAPSNLEVPGTWYGYPSILPVIDSTPTWVEVRLAQRPNESVSWVPRSDVTLGSTPYKIEVDLATEHLTVYENNQMVEDFPAGIGTTDDPTVTGNFFVTMQVPPPNAGYGPFVVVTSAHSDAITDWADSGDAIIAIHGPITSYDDSLIGSTGAAISHGCIRLHDADLSKLAVIPAGTPVDVVAS